MAKKAAPKRGASRTQPAAKKQPIPGWVWLASGLAIGGFVMFLMKLEPGNDAVRRPKGEEAQLASKSKQEASTPSPIKPKYDFYTLLPESEVIVPPDAVPQTAPTSTPPKPEAASPATAQIPPGTPPTPAQAAQIPAQAPKTAAAPPVTLFFLQAGSFRTQADADRVRAQIILIGQDVRVESGKVKDDTWYRVLVGPFNDRTQLTQAQKQLASNGFKNLLLQQRQGR
jgi:cell division protein FtsN